jgi:hypothetical protein
MRDGSERGMADPDCPCCKGLGYVRVNMPVGHPDFGSLALCRCRAEALERERLRRLESVSGLGPTQRIRAAGWSSPGETGRARRTWRPPSPTTASSRGSPPSSSAPPSCWTTFGRPTSQTAPSPTMSDSSRSAGRRS